MNNKYKLYILNFICFLFPIFFIEDIVPWVTALFFIHRNLKIYKEKNEIKQIVINTILCGGIIVIYNVIAKILERYLVGMFM